MTVELSERVVDKQKQLMILFLAVAMLTVPVFFREVSVARGSPCPTQVCPVGGDWTFANADGSLPMSPVSVNVYATGIETASLNVFSLGPAPTNPISFCVSDPKGACLSATTGYICNTIPSSPVLPVTEGFTAILACRFSIVGDIVVYVTGSATSGLDNPPVFTYVSAPITFHVIKQTPGITTTVYVSTGYGLFSVGSIVPLGGSSIDTVPTDGITLLGGAFPTGSISYAAYSDESCQNLVFVSANVPIGTPSSTFTPAVAGTYQWVATYNGDNNNNPVHTACGNEPLVVQRLTPIIASTLTPSRIIVGGSTTDLASVLSPCIPIPKGPPCSLPQPKGTITFTIFSDPMCKVQVLSYSPVQIGAPSPSFTPARAGIYEWIATYNPTGDPNYNAVSSNCGDEPLTVLLTPIHHLRTHMVCNNHRQPTFEFCRPLVRLRFGQNSGLQSVQRPELNSVLSLRDHRLSSSKSQERG